MLNKHFYLMNETIEDLQFWICDLRLKVRDLRLATSGQVITYGFLFPRR